MLEEAEAQILADIANVAEDGMCKPENGLAEEPSAETVAAENFEDPRTPLGDEYQPPDDSEEEDDIQITIGDIRTNVTTFRPSGPGAQRGVGGVGTGKPTQKLDMDATAEFQGSQIYDLELASMEGKPWPKPGADITDFFNYGFTEETWLIYYERQKKLRAEYGSAAAANKALFSSISLGIIPSVPVQSAGATTQLSSASQHQHRQQPSLPIIMRTVLTGPQQPEAPPGPAHVLTPAVPAPQPHQQQSQTDQAAQASLQTAVKSVPSLASNVGMSQAMLQSLQQMQMGSAQIDASPPNSKGMTPPPDTDEFSANVDTNSSSVIAQFATGPPIIGSNLQNSSNIVASSTVQPQTIPSSMVVSTKQTIMEGHPPTTSTIADVTSGVGVGQPPSSTATTSQLPPPGSFPDMTMPPPLRFPPTNLPPPGFPTAPPLTATAGMPLPPPSGMPGIPPPGMPTAVPGMPPPSRWLSQKL